MCGSHQREDVQRWIGVLQEKYPSLAKASIIYDITELETVKAEDDINDDHRQQPKLAAPS